MRTARSRAKALRLLGNANRAYINRLNAQIDSRAGFASTFQDTIGPNLSTVLEIETEKKIAADALQKLTQGKQVPDTSLTLIKKYNLIPEKELLALAAPQAPQVPQAAIAAAPQAAIAAAPQAAPQAPQVPTVRDMDTIYKLRDEIATLFKDIDVTRRSINEKYIPTNDEANVGVRYIATLVYFHMICHRIQELIKFRKFNIPTISTMIQDSIIDMDKSNKLINDTVALIKPMSNFLNLYDIPIGHKEKYKFLNKFIGVLTAFTNKYWAQSGKLDKQQVITDMEKIDRLFSDKRGSGTTIIPDINHIAHRIQLLLSEKAAGNGSTEVNNELQDLLDYLLQNKHITKKEYLKLNKQ